MHLFIIILLNYVLSICFLSLIWGALWTHRPDRRWRRGWPPGAASAARPPSACWLWQIRRTLLRGSYCSGMYYCNIRSCCGFDSSLIVWDWAGAQRWNIGKWRRCLLDTAQWVCPGQRPTSSTPCSDIGNGQGGRAWSQSVFTNPPAWYVPHSAEILWSHCLELSGTPAKTPHQSHRRDHHLHIQHLPFS